MRCDFSNAICLKKVKQQNRHSLRLEPLEDRMMLNADPIFVDTIADTLVDDGVTSLREAILAANAQSGQDTIKFAHDLQGELLLKTELVISDDLIIQGPGADVLTVSGQNRTRVFRIDVNPAQPFGLPVDEAGNPLLIEVGIHNLTIADGLATDAPGFPDTDPTGAPLFPNFAFGGGLFNRGAEVTLVGVHMTGNQAGGNATNNDVAVLTITGEGSGATYNQLNWGVFWTNWNQ